MQKPPRGQYQEALYATNITYCKPKQAWKKPNDQSNALDEQDILVANYQVFESSALLDEECVMSGIVKMVMLTVG
jgi:hypothetical protein